LDKLRQLTIKEIIIADIKNGINRTRRISVTIGRRICGSFKIELVVARAIEHTESPNTITLAASISLAISGSIGGIIAYKSVCHQKKQRELSAMLEAFKILNNNDHRRVRENVYCAFHLFQKDIFKDNPYHENAAMVRADMDQMGLLIQQS
jgi:hypothetical protein